MDIKSMFPEELETYLTEKGYPRFRADQVFSWLHNKRVPDYGQMTNLPAKLIAMLEEEQPLFPPVTADRQISRLDGTQKFLFALADGETVESVFMKYRFGNSICISSQAGCRMGCRFCASTLDGLKRNLAASEMLDQIYAIERTVQEKISHIVVMGTGEPLDNYDSLVRFLKLITHEKGMGLSRRSITVSTCGLVPAMKKLADEDLGITLALSLHAPTDGQRRKIMPIAQKYSISELMDACNYYFDRTGRRITFEYSLIKGVNDSAEDAEKLAALARSVGAHINLIPVNPVKEREYTQPEKDAVLSFKNKLEKHGINVSIRRVLGRDIDGACGQLRHRHLL